MVQKFINKIISGNKFLSIEILLQENKTQYYAIEVLQKKDALFIDSSKAYIDFEELLKNIPKNLPTLLSFTGQGIISKKVENTGNYRSKLLFNANADDFYWYELPQPQYIYASVVRKSVIDNELDLFKKHQVFIVDVSIGPLVVSVIKPLLVNANVLYTRNFKLDYENDNLYDFAKYSSDEDFTFYEIDGEKIELSDSVPFANLLNYLFPSGHIESEMGFLEINKQEFKFRKAFNTIGMIALPSFLLTLLVSYFLLIHYQKEYINLQVEFEEKNINYNKFILLKKDRDDKETMLNESGLNDSNFLSYYLSELTREIPAELNLIELSIFAPNTKIKPGQRILFSNDQIEIKGVTSSNSAFADWIKIIKNYTWVDNLEIVDFRKEGNTNNFEIRLKLKFNV